MIVVSSRDRLVNKGGRHYTRHISFDMPEGTTPECDRQLVLDVNDVTPFISDKASMTVEQMQTILTFLADVSVEENVLVNCTAGRSRSTATAIIVHFMMSGSEAAAADWLFTNYPKSKPNGWILKLADCMLESHLFEAACRRGFVKWKSRR